MNVKLRINKSNSRIFIPKRATITYKSGRMEIITGGMDAHGGFKKDFKAQLDKLAMMPTVVSIEIGNF